MELKLECHGNRHENEAIEMEFSSNSNYKWCQKKLCLRRFSTFSFTTSNIFLRFKFVLRFQQLTYIHSYWLPCGFSLQFDRPLPTIQYRKPIPTICWNSNNILQIDVNVINKYSNVSLTFNKWNKPMADNTVAAKRNNNNKIRKEHREENPPCMWSIQY